MESTTPVPPRVASNPQVFSGVDSRFLVHPQPKASVQQDGRNLSRRIQPVVLLSQDSARSITSIQGVIDRFFRTDDVFSQDFLTDIVVVPGLGTQTCDFILSQSLAFGDGINWEPVIALTLDGPSQTTVPPEGPYFLVDGKLHQAWRLYPDHLDSFLTTIVPTPDDAEKFEVLNVVSENGLSRAVGVPSRLYNIPSAEKPLAGKRISVKDNYKISGIQTTLSNRAFVDTYGPATETADFLVRLINLGAILIGKTKLCAFASSEEATDQWIDFHAPFNLRADNYQSPSGSTTGGATSLAGYEWLDFPLGLIYPAKLFYVTDFFPHKNPAQQVVVEEFIRVLEHQLGIERTNIGIAERWSQCPPSEAGEKSITEYSNKTGYYPFYYDGYHCFDDFRKKYEEMYGKSVFVGPYMRWKWDMGKEVTLEHKNKALEELMVYKKWFHENILTTDQSTGSDAVMVLPCGSGEPKYRDLPNASPGPVPAFSPNYIASMIGLPHLVVPIGQIPFDSRISKRTEHLPIVGSIVGAPGSDLMLLHLAKEALQNAGWPTEVKTGRFAFELGDGPRHVRATAEDKMP